MENETLLEGYWYRMSDDIPEAKPDLAPTGAVMSSVDYIKGSKEPIEATCLGWVWNDEKDSGSWKVIPHQRTREYPYSSFLKLGVEQLFVVYKSDERQIFRAISDPTQLKAKDYPFLILLNPIDESEIGRPGQYPDAEVEARAMSMIAMADEAVREAVDNKDFYANLYSIEFELEDGLDRAAADWLLKNGKQVRVSWNKLTINLKLWENENE